MGHQPDWRHLVITGPMGAGKTTVGRLVADRLGRPFVDSDAQIEESLATTARLLSQDKGLATLHDIEAGALTDALAGTEPAVVAAAASVADAGPADGSLFGAHFVVVLTGDPEVLHVRSASGEHRRQIPLEAARRLDAARLERLRLAADAVVDVTGRAPNEVAESVVAAFSDAPDQSL